MSTFAFNQFHQYDYVQVKTSVSNWDELQSMDDPLGGTSTWITADNTSFLGLMRPSTGSPPRFEHQGSPRGSVPAQALAAPTAQPQPQPQPQPKHYGPTFAASESSHLPHTAPAATALRQSPPVPPPQPVDHEWSARLSELAHQGAGPDMVLALTTQKLTGFSLSPPASPFTQSAHAHRTTNSPPPQFPPQSAPPPPQQQQPQPQPTQHAPPQKPQPKAAAHTPPPQAPSKAASPPASFNREVSPAPRDLGLDAGPSIWYTEASLARSPVISGGYSPSGSPSVPTAPQPHMPHMTHMTHMPAVAVDRGGGGRHTSQGQDGSLGGTMAPDVQHVLLKVRELEAQNQEAHRCIAELQAHLEEAHKRSEQQGASEQAAREALANAEKRILERKHQLESTQRQVDVLQGELKSVWSELDAERGHVAALNDELACAKGEAGECRREVEDVQRKMSHIGVEERRLQAEIQAVRKERDFLADAVAREKIEVQEARERVQQVQQDAERFMTRAARADAENESLAAQMRELRARCTELELRNSQLGYDVAAAREESARVRAEAEARALRMLQYQGLRPAGRPSVEMDTAAAPSWASVAAEPPPVVPAPYALYGGSPADKAPLNRRQESHAPPAYNASYINPPKSGAAAGFTSTLPPRPQAMDLGYGAPYSHGDYGQRFESGSGAESGAGYGPPPYGAAAAQPAATGLGPGSGQGVRRSLSYVSAGAGGGRDGGRGGPGYGTSLSPGSGAGPGGEDGRFRQAAMVGADVPFGTERTVQDLLARSQAMEDHLVALCQEKGKLDAEYAKMPLHGGRNARERARKVEVEERLEVINREASALRLALKKIHAK